MVLHRFCLDVESTSTQDLKKLGAAAYWAHPETHVILLRYRIDYGPVVAWSPGDPTPDFISEISPQAWRIVAHNYLFEFNCWSHKLGPVHGWGTPSFACWDCTMARALYWGLPAGMGDACDALALPVQKDASARPLMLRMSKPRTRNPVTWWHETDPDKLAALGEYCTQDVLAECALDDRLPALPDAERRVFLLDGEINQRGVRVDLGLVARLLLLTQAEGVRLNTEMAGLTDGRVKTTNQVKAILTELALLDVPVPSLAKEDVKTALRAILPDGGHNSSHGRAAAILLTRQEAAKASTAKLAAMAAGVSSDGRCKGLFQYGGAGRTMRWAGRRVQPQNYPRGTLKDVASFIAMVQAGAGIDDLRMLLPCSIMDAVSSALRGCFVAGTDRVLVSADLAQIEARVVAWLAGQKDVLDVFRAGEDVYVYTAHKIGSDDRQLGKVLVLACGFGMGPGKFQDTALIYGIKLSDDQASSAVFAWRDSNSRIVALWYAVDQAFRLVASSPDGTVVGVGQFLKIRRTKRAARIVLPSGREMTYHNVEVTPSADGTGRDEITFMGVDPKTKQWSRQRTYGGKLVENIVQATARDVMRDAMLAVAGGGIGLVGTVHDELLAETHEFFGAAALCVILEHMRASPSWGAGLPVHAEGWVGPRYRK